MLRANKISGALLSAFYPFDGLTVVIDLQLISAVFLEMQLLIHINLVHISYILWSPLLSISHVEAIFLLHITGWLFANTVVALAGPCHKSNLPHALYLSSFILIYFAIGKVETRISRLRDFTRYCGKTSVRLGNRGPEWLHCKKSNHTVYPYECGWNILTNHTETQQSKSIVLHSWDVS